MTKRTFGVSVLLAAPLAWGTGAFAYQCIHACGAEDGECAWINDSAQTYHISNEFSGWQKNSIEIGAGAWSAGSSELLRGADWHFTRGADVDAPFLGNGTLDVISRDNTWFTQHGCANCVGKTTMLWAPFCLRGEADVYLNSGVTWIQGYPSEASVTERSMAQVTMHEFGHVFGFSHDDTDGSDAGALDTMDGAYPAGGNPAAHFRILEGDYVGLREVKPGSSSGTNLMLSRYTANAAGVAVEVWEPFKESSNDWEGAPGACVDPARLPSSLTVLVTSTASSLSGVKVRYSLTADGVCFDDDDLPFDDVTLSTLTVDVPSVVQSSWCVPQTADPQMDYLVCARIDYDGSVSETSETDNTVLSELHFTVL